MNHQNDKPIDLEQVSRLNELGSLKIIRQHVRWVREGIVELEKRVADLDAYMRERRGDETTKEGTG